MLRGGGGGGGGAGVNDFLFTMNPNLKLKKLGWGMGAGGWTKNFFLQRIQIKKMFLLGGWGGGLVRG